MYSQYKDLDRLVIGNTWEYIGNTWEYWEYIGNTWEYVGIHVFPGIWEYMGILYGKGLPEGGGGMIYVHVGWMNVFPCTCNGIPIFPCILHVIYTQHKFWSQF